MAIDKKDTSSGDLFRPLTGLSIVVTGRLKTMTRRGAWAHLEEMGAVIRRQVTRKTDLVLIGDAPGQNAQRAEQLGVLVISENDILIGNLWDVRSNMNQARKKPSCHIAIRDTFS